MATQMTNTVNNFQKSTKGKYSIRDYSRNLLYKIRELPESSDDAYISYIQLEDNQTIEAVSNLLYDNVNYWDILIALNGIDPLLEMAYSFEVIADIAVGKLTKFETEVYRAQLPTIRRNEFLSEINGEIDTLNEQRRTIKIIKPYMMPTFLKILKDNGFITKY